MARVRAKARIRVRVRARARRSSLPSWGGVGFELESGLGVGVRGTVVVRYCMRKPLAMVSLIEFS